MITEDIKNHLLERDEHSHLDFKGLVAFLEEAEFEFVDVELVGPIGMATVDKIYLDYDKLDATDDQMVFFIILHEYCHGLRMKKAGKEATIASLSLDDFDKMFEHIVYEEILADRYGSLMYHKFNKESFPVYRTQRLTESGPKERYKQTIKPLHGMVDNDEEKYNKLMESFIV